MRQGDIVKRKPDLEFSEDIVQQLNFKLPLKESEYMIVVTGILKGVLFICIDGFPDIFFNSSYFEVVMSEDDGDSIMRQIAIQ